MRLSLIALLLLPLTIAIADPDIRYARSHHSFGHHSFGHHYPKVQPKVYINKPKIHLSSPGVHTGHSYPASPGYSGNVHHYPAVPNYPTNGHSYHVSTAKPGIIHSGNVRETYHQQHVIHHNSYTPRTEVHHYYNYNPPQRLRYDFTFHPVYQGHPPVYVYEYRNSGSRFDNLLTGLALYNLGRNSNFHKYGPDRRYSSAPGEVCKLGISKGHYYYEETRIDCNLMSSFIWDETPNTTRNEQPVVTNTTQVTVTQTVNGTGNETGNYSVTTVTTTNSTVEDALNVKGPSIKVETGMTCSMIRTFRDTITMRRTVDCGLLQEYARSSLQRSAAQCLTPLKTIIFNFLILYLPSNILWAN